MYIMAKIGFWISSPGRGIKYDNRDSGSSVFRGTGKGKTIIIETGGYLKDE